METAGIAVIVIFALIPLWLCWSTWNNPNDRQFFP